MAGQVTIEEGVVYGRADGEGRELRCDVYRPEHADGLLPGVLLIHGGGWRGRDRTQLRGYGVLTGREGYVCVAPEYRLAPESPWPAPLDAAPAALTRMRDHAAAAGLDTTRTTYDDRPDGAECGRPWKP